MTNNTTKRKQLSKAEQQALQQLQQSRAILSQSIEQELRLPELDEAKRPAILFIDDEGQGGDDQSYFRDLLAIHSEYYRNSMLLYTYNPTTTENTSKDTLEWLKQFMQNNRLDLLCLDRNMEGETGLELLRRINDDKATRYLPVIMVTRSNSNQDSGDTSAQKLLEAGAQRVIFAKSASRRLLYDVVMDLPMVQDSIHDQRWLDLLNKVDEELARSHRQQTRPEALLKTIGELISEYVEGTCWVRSFDDSTQVLRLAYTNDSNAQEVDKAVTLEKFPLLKESRQNGQVIRRQIGREDLPPNFSLRQHYIAKHTMSTCLQFSNELYGAISLYNDKESFNAKSESFLHHLVLRVTSFMAEFNSNQSLRHQQNQILKFSTAVETCHSEVQIIDRLLNFLHQELNSQTAGGKEQGKTTVRLLQANGYLDLAGHLGLPQERCKEPLIINLNDYANSMHAQAALSHTQLFCPELQEGSPYTMSMPGVRSLITAPLMSQNILLGTVNLENKQELHFAERDSNLVELACTLAADAIQDLRASEFVSGLLTMIGKVTNDTDYNVQDLLDSTCGLLYKLLNYQELLLLRRSDKEPYSLVQSYSKGKARKKNSASRELWSEHIGRIWGQSLMKACLSQDGNYQFANIWQWDSNKREEIRASEYPDDSSISEAKTRSRLVIKIGSSQRAPEYLLELLFVNWGELPERHKNLLTNLGDVLNGILSQHDRQQRLYGDLYVRERQAQMAMAYSQLIHTLRNKLSTIDGYFTQLESASTESIDILAKAHDAVGNTLNSVVGIRQLVKVPQFSQIDIDVVWNQVADELRSTLIHPYPTKLVWRSDPDIIHSIFFNLAQNALEAIGASNPEARIWLQAEVQSEVLLLHICNTGSSITINKSELFNLGVSSKPSSSGFGLHFSQLRTQDIRGELQLGSVAGADVAFTLKLTKEPDK